MIVDFAKQSWDSNYTYQVTVQTNVSNFVITEDIYSINIQADLAVEQGWRFGGGVSSMLELKLNIGKSSYLQTFKPQKGDIVNVRVKGSNMDSFFTYKRFKINEILKENNSILTILAYDELYWLKDIYTYNKDDFPCTIFDFIKKIYKEKGYITSQEIENSFTGQFGMQYVRNGWQEISENRGRFLDGKQYLEILRDIAEVNNIFLSCNNDFIPVFITPNATMSNDPTMPTTYPSLYFNFKNNYIKKIEIDNNNNNTFTFSNIKTKWRNGDILDFGTKNIYTAPVYTNNNNIIPYLYQQKNDKDYGNKALLNISDFYKKSFLMGNIESKANFGVEVGDVICIQGPNLYAFMFVTSLEINNFTIKITGINPNGSFYGENSPEISYTENFKDKVDNGGVEAEMNWLIQPNFVQNSALRDITINTSSFSQYPPNKVIVEDIEPEKLKKSSIVVNYNIPIVIFGYNGDVVNYTPCNITLNTKVALIYGYYNTSSGLYKTLGKIGEKNGATTIPQGEFLSYSFGYFKTYLNDSVAINTDDILKNEIFNDANAKMFIAINYIMDFSYNNKTNYNYTVAWGTKTDSLNINNFNITYTNIFRSPPYNPKTYIFNYLTAKNLNYNKEYFIDSILLDAVTYPNTSKTASWIVTDIDNLNYIMSYNVEGKNNGHGYGYIKISIKHKFKVSFKARTDSELGYDFGYLHISKNALPFKEMSAMDIKNSKDYGGTWIYKESGRTDYKEVETNEILPGEYYLSFGYIKDGSGNSYTDSFYIDNIKIQELP